MSEARHRLPLRLEPPPRGRGCRLQWLAKDQALVLRGEPLCEAFSEGDPEPLRLLSPAAGRLRRLVPNADRVPPTALLGELECGPDWDRTMCGAAQHARAEVRERLGFLRSQHWMRWFRHHHIAAIRALVLEGDISQFDYRAQARSGAPLPLRPGRPQQVAAALLNSLRETPPAFLRPSPGQRQELAALAERLRRKFSLADCSGWSPLPETPPPELPSPLRWLELLEELEQSYDAAIAACAERITGFPPELQQAKLNLWQDIKQEELRRLAGEAD